MADLVASPTDILYSPQEIGEFTLAEIAERRANKGTGVKFGIDEIDRVLLPLRPGELVSIIGLAGNFKSGLMMYLARQALKQVTEDQVVIYATWEQAVEEHALVELANATHLDVSQIARGEITDAEWDLLHRAAQQRQVRPLWLIGHSVRAHAQRPHLTVDAVEEAIRTMDSKGYRPGIIFVDYLQRIEHSAQSIDRRVDQMRSVDRCKDLALSLGCPVVLGVQAKQDVLDKKFKLPGIYDAQETSNVAQSSDKILSVWMPKTTEALGDKIKSGNGTQYTVDDHLLAVAIGKQKFGEANRVFWLRVEPSHNEVASFIYPGTGR